MNIEERMREIAREEIALVFGTEAPVAEIPDTEIDEKGTRLRDTEIYLIRAAGEFGRTRQTALVIVGRVRSLDLTKGLSYSLDEIAEMVYSEIQKRFIGVGIRSAKILKRAGELWREDHPA